MKLIAEEVDLEFTQRFCAPSQNPKFKLSFKFENINTKHAYFRK